MTKAKRDVARTKNMVAAHLKAVERTIVNQAVVEPENMTPETLDKAANRLKKYPNG